MKLSIFVFFYFNILFNCYSADYQEFLYVSKNGSDSNTGTIDRPFATIGGALQKAKTFNNVNVTIQIREGKYTIFHTVNIGEFRNLKHLTLQAYNNEQVIFTGGVTVKREDIQKCTDPIIIRTLSPKLHSRLFKIRLSELGITNNGDFVQHGHRKIYTAPLEIFEGDEPLHIARWPNSGFLELRSSIDKKGLDSNFVSFKFPNGRPDKWKETNDIWIAGFLSNGYSDTHLKIKSIHKLDQIVDVNIQRKDDVDNYKGPNSQQDSRRFYFYNVLEELDSPGEWFLNKKTNEIYFLSKDPDFKEINISVASEPILSLVNARNVTINKITLGFGRDMGIFAKNTSNIEIKNVVLKNFGTFAISLGKNTSDKKMAKNYEDLISFDRNSNFRIVSCTISNTGTGGIFLTGGLRKTLEPGKNSVYNTRIHNYNRRNLTSCPAVFIGGVSNSVLHCEISESSGQAIMYWGNDHVISYNKISDVCRDINDQGAVYTGRDPSSTGTSIMSNLFYNIKGLNRSVAAVYIDDGSGGINVSNNIFLDCGSSGPYQFGAIHINGGGNNTFLKNIFLKCERGVSINVWTTKKWAEYLATTEMKKKIFSNVDITSNLFEVRYPFLRRLDINYGTGKNIFRENYLLGVKAFASNINNITSSDNISLDSKCSNCEISPSNLSTYTNLFQDKKGKVIIDVAALGIN